MRKVSGPLISLMTITLLTSGCYDAQQDRIDVNRSNEERDIDIYFYGDSLLNDFGYSIDVLPGNEIVVYGRQKEYTGELKDYADKGDATILKTDLAGNQLSYETVQEEVNLWYNSPYISSDSTLIVIKSFHNPDSIKTWKIGFSVYRLSMDKEVLSKMDYQQGWSLIRRQLAKTDDGGFIVAGDYFENKTDNFETHFIYRFDKYGNLTWSKFYPEIKLFRHLYDLEIDDRLNIYLLGNRTKAERHDDWNRTMHDRTYIVKYNEDGEFKSIIGEDPPIEFSADEMRVLEDGSIILTGTEDASGKGFQSRAIYARINSQGDILWKKNFNLDVEVLSGLVILPWENDNYLLVGNCKRHVGKTFIQDVYLTYFFAVIDQSGNVLDHFSGLWNPSSIRSVELVEEGYIVAMGKGNKRLAGKTFWQRLRLKASKSVVYNQHDICIIHYRAGKEE